MEDLKAEYVLQTEILSRARDQVVYCGDSGIGGVIGGTKQAIGTINGRPKADERDRHGRRGMIGEMSGIWGRLWVGAVLGDINTLLKVSKKGSEVVRRE